MSHPTTTPIPHRATAALAVVAGILMATYLLLRPYGDSRGGQTSAAAEAFASPMWIWSHLAAAAALVALAALWATLVNGPMRWAAILGAALVLPYYGAETFALHEIGARARVEPGVLALVPAVRDNPVAMTLFGVGLIVLAAAGVAAALAWRRARKVDNDGGRDDGRRPGRLATAYLPLASVAALFLPQFFLPPVGRMTYGVLFAATAAYAGYVLVTTSRPRSTAARVGASPAAHGGRTPSAL